MRTRFWIGMILSVMVGDELLGASGEPMVKYDFTGDVIGAVGKAQLPPPKLNGNPIIAGNDGVNAIALDGKSFIAIPQSGKLHLNNGGTLYAVVKFNDSGTLGGTADAHDAIFFKPDEFVFARSQKNFYVNLKSGKSWIPMATNFSGVPTGEWVQLVATIITSEVDKYEIRLYINGKIMLTKSYRGKADTTDNPVTLGKGWGGPWYMNGEIAEAAIYDYPLTDAEIIAMGATNPLVKNKITRK